MVIAANRKPCLFYGITLLWMICLSGCASTPQERLADTLTVPKLIERANQSYQNGDFLLAKQQYESALKLDPKEQIALYRLGNIAFKNGEIAQASDYYIELLNLNPNHTNTHYNLAICRLIQARGHLQRYLIGMDPAKDPTLVQEMLNNINAFAGSR